MTIPIVIENDNSNISLQPRIEDTSMQHWYAVFTKPKREQVAAENLRRQGFHVYLPRLRHRRRRRGAWVPVIEALFPRYLFVAVDTSRQAVAPIRFTYGVSDLVRFGNDLVPVPCSVIEFLKGREDRETGLHELERTLFHEGGKVRVVGGPFVGIDGVFQADRGQDRVLILLDVLGRAQPVTLARNDIAPSSA